ncbi:MAG TPA: AarF/UbiB family protein [Pyrinomonadaceae bacterium]|nr:AarF/UbiB family protein [Pyrinomonadaceae bacterium]
MKLKDLFLDVRRALLPLWLLLNFGLPPLLRYFLGLRQKDRDYPKNIRLALERLGLTYLKLGQFLAMRLDLVPQEVCQELAQLYEDVSPVPFEKVKAAVESELRAPLASLFPVFEREPVAAASVAQVHEARTRSNERVAVKIQRPGIGRIFAADLRNLRRIASLADRLRLFGTLSLKEVVDEFGEWTTRELDFITEGRTAERLRRNAAEYEVVPLIYWELTTRKVLTMEFIDAPSLAQVLSLAEQGRDEVIFARLPNLDFGRAGSNMAQACLRQLFVDGFFHGDPHPGNILILDGNRVAFVDFGIFGRLSDYQREVLAAYIESTAVGNLNQSVRNFLKLATPTEETDLRAFELEATGILRRWYESSRSPAATFKERAMGKYFGELLSAVRRHRLRMRVDTLIFWRALNSLDYSALTMSRHFDLLRELRKFFKQLRPGPAERVRSVLTDKALASEVVHLWARLPGHLEDLLKGSLGESERLWPTVGEAAETHTLGLDSAKWLSATAVGVSLMIIAVGHVALPARVLALSLGALLLTRALAATRPR